MAGGHSVTVHEACSIGQLGLTQQYSTGDFLRNNPVVSK